MVNTLPLAWSFSLRDCCTWMEFSGKIPYCTNYELSRNLCFFFCMRRCWRIGCYPTSPRRSGLESRTCTQCMIEERIGFLMSFVWCCQIGHFGYSRFLWGGWFLSDPQSRYHHHAKRQSTREGWASFRRVPDHVPICRYSPEKWPYQKKYCLVMMGGWKTTSCIVGTGTGGR